MNTEKISFLTIIKYSCVLMSSLVFCTSCNKHASDERSTMGETEMTEAATTSAVETIFTAEPTEQQHNLWTDDVKCIYDAKNEGISVYMGDIDGQEWFDKTKLPVYGLDREGNIAYEEYLQYDESKIQMIEYYLVNSSLYEFCTEKTDDGVMYSWKKCCGETVVDELKNEYAFTVDYSDTQAFIFVEAALEHMETIKEKGICVLRVGTLDYDINPDTYWSVIEGLKWLDLGYYQSVEGNIQASITALQACIKNQGIPSEYMDMYNWITQITNQTCEKKLWFIVDDNTLNNENLSQLNEAIDEGVGKLLSGQQEAFLICLDEEMNYTLKMFDLSEQMNDGLDCQDYIMCCSAKKLTCTEDRAVFTIGVSGNFEPEEQMLGLIAGGMLGEKPTQNERVFIFPESVETYYEGVVDGMIIRTREDIMGNAYMTSIMKGVFNPPGNFYCPQGARADKDDILKDQGVWWISCVRNDVTDKMIIIDRD